MRKRNLVTILFPTFFMSIITIFSFTNMLDSYNDVKFEGLFLASLILFFPLLFILQGIISALNNTNIFIALGISILTYLILMFLYLNDSAFIYVFIYLVFGFLGYSIINFFKKVK